MSTQQPEISVKVTLDGTGQVKAELLGLGEQAQRTQGRMRQFGQQVKTDFSRLGTTLLAPFRGLFDFIRNGIAGIAFAAPLAGAYAFLQSIRDIKGATIEAAREINRMDARALALNVKGRNGQSDAATFGALEQMLASAGGLEDGDNMKDILSTLLETAEMARKGDQGSIDKLKAAGLDEWNFFIPGTEDFKPTLDILEEIANVQKTMSQERSLAGMIGLLGDEDGLAAAALFAMTTKEMRAFIDEYFRLTDIRPSDESWAKSLARELTDMNSALFGARTAVGRGYGDSLEKITANNKEMLVKLFPDLEDIGDEAGKFSEKVNESFIRTVGNIRQHLATGAGEISGGPMTTALDWLAKKIDDVMVNVDRTAEYVLTGETQHEGIRQWVDFVGDILSIIGAIARVALVLGEAMQPLVSGLAWVAESIEGAFGEKSLAYIVGIGGALLYFRGSIVSVVGAMTGWSGAATGVWQALKRIAPYAKNVAKVAGVIGAAYTVGTAAVSEADNAVLFANMLSEANRRAAIISETEGETAGQAYAAAYIKASAAKFKESGNMSLAARLGEWLESDGDIEAIIGKGLVVDPKAVNEFVTKGVNDALKDAASEIGTEIKLNNNLEIAAGIVVKPTDITVAENLDEEIAQDVIGKLADGTPITAVVEDVDTSKVVSTDGRVLLPATMRIDNVDFKKFLDVSGKFLVNGGLNDLITDATKLLTPVNITIEGVGALPTMFAPNPDVARQIESSISRARRSQS